MDLKNSIWSLLIFSGAACAQVDNDTIEKKWFKSYPDKLSAQIFVLNTSNEFTFDYLDEDLSVNIVPNKKTTLGVAVQYDFIALSWGFAPNFFSENKDNENSKMTSFTFNMFPGRFMQHFDFYYQKGFSITEENLGANIYFSQLKSIKAGGSTAYLFNKNFSYRATAFQSEKQLKSVGSFAPTLSYYYTSLDGRKVDALHSRAYFIDVAVSPAYYYNWVIGKNFLISGGAALGAGFTYTNDDGDRETTFLTQASLQLALGYNSDTYYGGLNTKGFVLNHRNNTNVSVSDAIGYFTLFAGYRFDAPKFLTEKTAEFHQKMDQIQEDLKEKKKAKKAQKKQNNKTHQ